MFTGSVLEKLKYLSLHRSRNLIFQYGLKMFNLYICFFYPLGVFDSLTPLLKPFDKEHAMLHVQHVNEIRKCIKEERERVKKKYF